MATANYKKFDVKHGISVNGLPFVDEDRNVTVNDLTVQGVSTIVDTRSITAIDPIIKLGAAGNTYTSEEVSGNAILFSAETFDDIAVGDAISYDSGDLTYDDGLGGGPVAVTQGTVFYIASRDNDPLSATYRQITLENTPGAADITGTFASAAGPNVWTLNPLRDLNQDLGVAFNYVDGTPKEGFFGYSDTTGQFTFLLDSSYGGSDSSADSSSPIFSGGEKGGIDVKNIKLNPTNALTTSLPAVDIDQTWNGAGISFRAFTIDVTDTDSATASTLLDVSIDAQKKLSLRKDGSLAVNTSTYSGALSVSGTTTSKLIYGEATWVDPGTVYNGIEVAITETSFDPTSKLLSLNGGAARYFDINAYGNVVSKTEFTSGGIETALIVDVTNTSSDSDSLLLDLQTGSTSKFSVDLEGNISATGSLSITGDIDIDGPGVFRDNVDIEASVSGTYELNSRTLSEYTEIAAGANSATTIATFDGSVFTTGKYVIQLKQGALIHSAEILLIHDGSNAYVTEYGAIYNTEIIGLLDASVSGSDVILTVTPTASIVSNNAIIEARVVTLSISV